MAMRKLFSKSIEPRCTYCVHGTPLSGGDTLTCQKHGVVHGTDACRKFQYDPLRRIPPKPAKLGTRYSAIDFSLGDIDNET